MPKICTTRFLMNDKTYKTEQEDFWSGDFGNEYISRNKGEMLLASNLNFFTKALARATNLNSCIEFGANIGMNLRALKLLRPELSLNAIEINQQAAEQLSDIVNKENIYTGSILDYPANQVFDLSFIKGVLIHINPNELNSVYKKLVDSTSRYLLVAEYYNPSPISIPYRGHKDRLFKRDFAGEILDQFPAIKLIDYGFSYHRDIAFPQDDISWFLMEKESK